MSGPLSSAEDFITSNVVPKTQTYHLVTAETLSAIKEKSMVADIFMLLASLLFGAFFSALITLNASVGLPEQTVAALNIYKWVFLGFGIVFLVLTLIAVGMGNGIIKKIRQSE